MTWDAFAAAAPALAVLGLERFDRKGMALVGTLRRDGWPRITPVEPYTMEMTESSGWVASQSGPGRPVLLRTKSISP